MGSLLDLFCLRIGLKGRTRGRASQFHTLSIAMQLSSVALSLGMLLGLNNSAAGDSETVAGRKVKVFTEALPWHEAQRVCIDHGMNLLGLHNAQQEKDALRLAHRDILPGFWVHNTIQREDPQEAEHKLNGQAFGETILGPQKCDLADTRSASGFRLLKSLCSRNFPFMCEGEAVQERCSCKSEEEKHEIVDNAGPCNESHQQLIETQRTVFLERILGLEKSLATGQLEMNQCNEDLESKVRELDRMSRLKEWLMILIGIVSCLLLVTIVVASVICGISGRKGSERFSR